MAIVSFSRNFIFIKTRKCSGTAIQQSLINNCDSCDIVSFGHDNLITGRPCKIEEFASLSDIKSAYEIRSDDYFKFGFVRNPYDIVLSRFLFQIRRKNKYWEFGADGFNKWIREKYFVNDFYKQDTSHLLFIKIKIGRAHV